MFNFDAEEIVQIYKSTGKLATSGSQKIIDLIKGVEQTGNSNEQMEYRG